MKNNLQVYSFRAQCRKVIDGDTLDLYVDLGFHQYMLARFRLYGVDTPELNSKDSNVRATAQLAKSTVESFLPVSYDGWPLQITTHKDPDNFGRWLANVRFVDADGLEKDLGATLILLGLAVTR